MSVSIQDDRIVVEPSELDVNDFLEYAELAIQRFGWRQGERTMVHDDNMAQVATEEGLSLHDAIGYTNVMLGGGRPGKATGKDDSTSGRSMRTEMAEAVQKVLPKGKDDKTFNDTAKSADAVIGVLRRARGVKAK